MFLALHFDGFPGLLKISTSNPEQNWDIAHFQQLMFNYHWMWCYIISSRYLFPVTWLRDQFPTSTRQVQLLLKADPLNCLPYLKKTACSFLALRSKDNSFWGMVPLCDLLIIPILILAYITISPMALFLPLRGKKTSHMVLFKSKWTQIKWN